MIGGYGYVTICLIVFNIPITADFFYNSSENCTFQYKEAISPILCDYFLVHC